MMLGLAAIFMVGAVDILHSSYLRYRLAHEGLAVPVKIVSREIEHEIDADKKGKYGDRETLYWNIEYQDASEKVYKRKVWVDVKENTRTSANILYLRENPEAGLLDFELDDFPWWSGGLMAGMCLGGVILLLYFAHRKER